MKVIIQFVLTIVGYLLCCVLYRHFSIMATSIWDLVESIMILTGKINTDGNGIPLID